MKTFLHVGCGPNRQQQTTQGFATDGWRELRLDINPAVVPDVVGSMTDMTAVASGSVDAVFSSHNIEHLYPHEVPVALAEFYRVLSDEGFLVLTCPELKSVCALVAEDKLTDPAYQSPAGQIAPIDVIYGYRAAMSQGNLFMAHRTGFTEKTLIAALQAAGFMGVASMSRPEVFDIWAVATKMQASDAMLRDLAAAQFPLGPRAAA